MMKRVIVVFLAASCFITSCSLFKGRDYSEEEKAITEAKNGALTAIDDAKTAAVSDAQESIRSLIANAVEGASEDISSTINDAKNEIQASAEKSVNQTLNEKLKTYEDDLAKSHRNAIIAGIIGLVSLILAIVFFVLLWRRTSRDEVIETIEGSRRIKDLISTTIEAKQDTAVRSYNRQGVDKNVIETEIRRYFESPAAKQFIAGLVANQEKGAKGVPNPNLGQTSESRGTQEFAQVPPRVELYAKDSPDNVLLGVTSSYVQGKSIYRLILNSQDAQTAEISICTDKEDVKSRILKSSNDLLEPVCKVDRKRSNPGDLSSVSIRPGKAERLSSDSWKVVEPITVELS